MSQAPQTNVTPPPDRPPGVKPASDVDPLAGLHKMSTTAGVTNLDYVAVNHTAIAAVLLGLLSALSFFGYLLLVIPILGAIFAIIALRQIADSNGTQTGRGLAALALALCVILGGTAIAREAIAVLRVKGTETAIATTIAKVGDAIRQEKYKDAYEHFDPDFRAKVSLERFQSRWQTVQSTDLGKLEVLEWNGVTPVFESADNRRLAITKVRVKFAKGFDDRFDIILREDADKWDIFRLESFFPTAPPPGTGGQKSNDVFNF
jgi:hypothetical protein